jgi:hypothetical protein
MTQDVTLEANFTLVEGQGGNGSSSSSSSSGSSSLGGNNDGGQILGANTETPQVSGAATLPRTGLPLSLLIAPMLAAAYLQFRRKKD